MQTEIEAAKEDGDMSKFKGTPKPWLIQESATSTSITVRGASGQAVFHESDKRIDGVIADARLIAAAPELLDALADGIVTAAGLAYMQGMDIDGALAEVNRSNFSKFENGHPVFLNGGKIGKGRHYTPPELEPFLNRRK